MIIRQYKITLSTGSVYEKGDEEASSFEGHFKAFLRGNIRTNRKRLADFLIPLFQKQVYNELGVRIGRAHIRVGFEREESALSSSRQVSAEFRIIKYHGKHHVAKRLPPRSFALRRARRRRKHKRKTSNRHRWMRSTRDRRKTRSKRSKRGKPGSRRG
jgi:hypothetical protein